MVSILLILSFAGIASAGQNENKFKIAVGAVKAIDPTSKAITLMADNRPDFTCLIDDKTTLRSGAGSPVSYADIKVGNLVVLVYEEVEGKNVARALTLTSQSPLPSPAKK